MRSGVRISLSVFSAAMVGMLLLASHPALAQSPSAPGSGALAASPGMSAAPGSSAPSGPAASGNPDACALVSPDELQAATGIALPAGTLQAADGRQVCQWSAGGVSVWLFLQPADPNIFESQKQTTGTPVTGIGDDAYSVAGPAQLYILSGSTLLSLLVTGTTGDPAAIEVQLAQDALARL